MIPQQPPVRWPHPTHPDLGRSGHAYTWPDRPRSRGYPQAAIDCCPAPFGVPDWSRCYRRRPVVCRPPAADHAPARRSGPALSTSAGPALLGRSRLGWSIGSQWQFRFRAWRLRTTARCPASSGNGSPTSAAPAARARGRCRRTRGGRTGPDGLIPACHGEPTGGWRVGIGSMVSSTCAVPHEDFCSAGHPGRRWPGRCRRLRPMRRVDRASARRLSPAGCQQRPRAAPISCVETIGSGCARPADALVIDTRGWRLRPPLRRSDFRRLAPLVQIAAVRTSRWSGR